MKYEYFNLKKKFRALSSVCFWFMGLKIVKGIKIKLGPKWHGESWYHETWEYDENKTSVLSLSI